MTMTTWGDGSFNNNIRDLLNGFNGDLSSISERLENIELGASDLSSRMTTAESDIDIIESDIGDILSRCGTLETKVGALEGINIGTRLTSIENINAVQNGRLDSLDTWKGVMPKRQDRYTGTTDANGDVTITFPTSRYTNSPHIAMTYIFNNDSYGTFYNIKSLSNTSVTIRVMRNKNSAVLLGGNIDPDEPLASTSVVVIATEFA